MINKPYGIGATLLLVGVMSAMACLSSTSSENRPQEVLVSMADTIIAPRFDTLTVTAQQMQVDVAQLCETPTNTSLENARTAWRATRSAWRQIEPFFFGPHSRIPTRYGRVLDFWPVREGKIDELIESEDELSGEILSNKGAVVRGIPALEYVLFGGPSASLVGGANGDRVCLVAASMAEDIHGLSVALRDQWLKAPDAYIDVLKTPEIGEFMDVRGALSEVVNRMGFTIENMRVDRLGTPLGDKVGGQLMPDLVESRYSDHSLEDLRQVLVTIETLFQGSGTEGSYGLIDMPRIQGRQDIIDAFQQALASARAALSAIPEPLKDNLDQTEVVRTAYDRLGDLQRVIQGDVINVLGLSLAFNDADGD